MCLFYICGYFLIIYLLITSYYTLYFSVFEVTDTHCEKIGEMESLPLYVKYYNPCDEKRTLFSIYKDQNGPIPAKSFELYFWYVDRYLLFFNIIIYNFNQSYMFWDINLILYRESGGLEASHCVDHRVMKEKKEGFYFHRLVFRSSEDALEALTNLNKTKNITSKFPYQCSKLHEDKKIQLFVSEASIELLNYIIQYSDVKWCMRKIF